MIYPQEITRHRNQREKKPSTVWVSLESIGVKQRMDASAKGLRKIPPNPRQCGETAVMLQGTKEGRWSSTKNLEYFPDIYICFESQGEISDFGIRKWMSIFNNNARLIQGVCGRGSCLHSGKHVQKVTGNSWWKKKKENEQHNVGSSGQKTKGRRMRVSVIVTHNTRTLGLIADTNLQCWIIYLPFSYKICTWHFKALKITLGLRINKLYCCYLSLSIMENNDSLVRHRRNRKLQWHRHKIPSLVRVNNAI